MLTCRIKLICHLYRIVSAVKKTQKTAELLFFFSICLQKELIKVKSISYMFTNMVPLKSTTCMEKVRGLQPDKCIMDENPMIPVGILAPFHIYFTRKTEWLQLFPTVRVCLNQIFFLHGIGHRFRAHSMSKIDSNPRPILLNRKSANYTTDFFFLQGFQIGQPRRRFCAEIHR